MSSLTDAGSALTTAYNRDGYVRTDPLFDADALGIIREQVDTLIAALPPDQPTDRMLNWHMKSDVLMDLALNDALLEPVRALIGPDLALFNTRLMIKPARGGRTVGWHQDIAYFPIEPAKIVTLWLALDTVGPDNAPLLVAPACHENGIYPHHKVAEGEVFSEAIDADAHNLTTPIAVTLPAGAAVLMDGFTPHASDPNRADHRRTAFIARYIATDTRLIRDRRALYGADYPLVWISGRRGANTYINPEAALSRGPKIKDKPHVHL